MEYTIILDTSAAIELLEKNNEKVKQAITAQEHEEVVLSAISKFELEVAEEKKDSSLEQIPCISASCSALSLAAQMYSILKERGKMPPLKDCFIAACAIDANALLISCDKDFRLFEEFGLKIKIV